MKRHLYNYYSTRDRAEKKEVHISTATPILLSFDEGWRQCLRRFTSRLKIHFESATYRFLKEIISFFCYTRKDPLNPWQFTVNELWDQSRRFWGGWVENLVLDWQIIVPNHPLCKNWRLSLSRWVQLTSISYLAISSGAHFTFLRMLTSHTWSKWCQNK